MSYVFSAFKCTPPIPPVAKNFIPNIDAIDIVLATVVAAFSFLNIDKFILWFDTFCTLLSFASMFMSSSFNPILTLPFIIPIVAATEPLSSTALIDSLLTP